MSAINNPLDRVIECVFGCGFDRDGVKILKQDICQFKAKGKNYHEVDDFIQSKDLHLLNVYWYDYRNTLFVNSYRLLSADQLTSLEQAIRDKGIETFGGKLPLEQSASKNENLVIDLNVRNRGYTTILSPNFLYPTLINDQLSPESYYNVTPNDGETPKIEDCYDAAFVDLSN